MLAGRKARIARLSVVTALAVLVAGLAVPGASADPDPSVDDVQARVDALHHEAEEASERYNTIKATLGDTRDELRAVSADAAAQQQDTEQLRARVEQLVLAQVDGSGVSTTSKLLLADDPDEFLSSMAAMRSYSEQSSDLLAAYENSRTELSLREQQVEDQLAAISAAEEQMAEEKAAIEDKAEAAEELLAELEAEAAARAAEAAARAAAAEEASRDETTPPADGTTTEAPTGDPVEEPTTPTPPTPVSGNAAVAVETALAQVGDAYVYGAAGPDAFDCSGLTMYAWRAAGVSLSHSSSVQSTQGTPVSLDALMPGDLIFYYSPVSHVGMYIGNGQIVHAANPSRPVEVVSMNLMPISWARRVG